MRSTQDVGRRGVRPSDGATRDDFSPLAKHSKLIDDVRSILILLTSKPYSTSHPFVTAHSQPNE